MKRFFQPAVVLLTAAMLQAVVPASADPFGSVLTLDDNGTHNLNSAVTEDHVEVYNTTTVNLLTGGSIGDELRAYNNSTVNVSGGEIGGYLRAYGSGRVNLSGGTIEGGLDANHSSTVTIFGTGFNLGGVARWLTTITWTAVCWTAAFWTAHSQMGRPSAMRCGSMSPARSRCRPFPSLPLSLCSASAHAG